MTVDTAEEAEEEGGDPDPGPQDAEAAAVTVLTAEETVPGVDPAALPHASPAPRSPVHRAEASAEAAVVVSPSTRTGTEEVRGQGREVPLPQRTMMHEPPSIDGGEA